jgi:hypothetical protein
MRRWAVASAWTSLAPVLPLGAWHIDADQIAGAARHSEPYWISYKVGDCMSPRQGGLRHVDMQFRTLLVA